MHFFCVLLVVVVGGDYHRGLSVSSFVLVCSPEHQIRKEKARQEAGPAGEKQPKSNNNARLYHESAS